MEEGYDLHNKNEYCSCKQRLYLAIGTKPTSEKKTLSCAYRSGQRNGEIGLRIISASLTQAVIPVVDIKWFGGAVHFVSGLSSGYSGH